MLTKSPLDVFGWLNEAEQKYLPERLFLAGDIGLLTVTPRVSIIGSRSATEEGKAKAALLAKMVVRAGGVVVSGLAKGIDTAAHRSAIDSGGRTIAVIGTPLGRAYPAENKALQAEIAERHLVVSQFESGQRTFPSHFIKRNRTMALLSNASIIVEAGKSSGTEHQGWEAIRLGRLLALPKKLLDAEFEWPRDMLNYGAFAFDSLNSLQEIFDEYLPVYESYRAPF